MSDAWQDDDFNDDLPTRKTIYEIMQHKPIKLELGGGVKPVGGYINVDVRGDLDTVDFVADVSSLDDFLDGDVDKIFARDVLHCFHREEVVGILRTWFRKLRRSSALIVQVPDMAQLFKLYADGKVCMCWSSSTRKADEACTTCNGESVMNYDKFQRYVFGRNRRYDMFKSAYDLTDLKYLIERAGFTVMDTETKDLRIVIIAKKIIKRNDNE